MRWFRRRGKGAGQSPPGTADFTADPDAFAAPMAEGFEESYVPGVCDICGTSSHVFSCQFCEDEGVKRPPKICWDCYQGPVWEDGDSHAAAQHPLRRYVFHAISVMFRADDLVRGEVQKSLLAESSAVTANDTDARAIVAMAEPLVEHYIEAASEAAKQAIYQARISAHRAMAAFLEGRVRPPDEEAGRHPVGPTDFYAAVTDAFKAPMAEGFADRQRTEPDGDTPPHRTVPDPVAAVCGLCGSNGDNGWVERCVLCEVEGTIPPLQVCNVCWITREIIEPHVATKHPNNRHIYHAVTVQHLLGYWLRDEVQSSLFMECTMFPQIEDPDRCIEMARPDVASLIGAAADAAAKSITESRNAVHEAARLQGRTIRPS